ncbi:MAG TPA: (d)CMP kinase [Acidimicrobiales bacterium]|jgi:CMP/dCMP kinase|nr:(d)CMP kinase [Acidimicrobiales bacterium]
MTGTITVIAIDGPAGSGKSTIAKLVADRLGLAYLDTGAMYRSIAYAALRDGIDPADADAVSRLAIRTSIVVDGTVVVDGDDATVAIRGPEVSGVVSVVSAHPDVRAELVRRQREWARQHGGGVVEGRDIGTVVFPDATLKVFLTASEEERVRRRAAQSGAEVAAHVTKRDHLDSNRAVSPLAAAEDALVVDTTGRSIDDIVEEVLSKL